MIRIITNTQSYGPKPAKGTEIEQHLSTEDAARSGGTVQYDKHNNERISFRGDLLHSLILFPHLTARV